MFAYLMEVVECIVDVLLVEEEKIEVDVGAFYGGSAAAVCGN